MTFLSVSQFAALRVVEFVHGKLRSLPTRLIPAADVISRDLCHALRQNGMKVSTPVHQIGDSASEQLYK